MSEATQEQARPKKQLRWRRYTAAVVKAPGRAAKAIVKTTADVAKRIGRRVARLTKAQVSFAGRMIGATLALLGLLVSWLWITAWRLICLFLAPVWWIVGNVFYAWLRGMENAWNLFPSHDAAFMHATFPVFTLHDAEAFNLVSFYPLVCFGAWLLSPATGRTWYVLQMDLYRSDLLILADDEHWGLFRDMVPYPQSEFTGHPGPDEEGDTGLIGVSESTFADFFPDHWVHEDGSPAQEEEELPASPDVVPDAPEVAVPAEPVAPAAEAIPAWEDDLPNPKDIPDPGYRSFILGRTWVRQAVAEQGRNFLNDRQAQQMLRSRLAKQASGHNSGLRRKPALDGYDTELEAILTSA